MQLSSWYADCQLAAEDKAQRAIKYNGNTQVPGPFGKVPNEETSEDKNKMFKYLWNGDHPWPGDQRTVEFKGLCDAHNLWLHVPDNKNKELAFLVFNDANTHGREDGPGVAGKCYWIKPSQCEVGDSDFAIYARCEVANVKC